MDVGTMPDWITAIASVAATGAASVAGAVALRVYQQERLKQRRSYAEGVHAWVAGDGEGGLNPRLVIVNSSGALIHDIRVELTFNDVAKVAPSKDAGWVLLPPGNFVVRPFGGRWDFPRPVVDLHDEVPISRTERFRVTSLEFTDADGLAWSRDAKGRLSDRPRIA